MHNFNLKEIPLAFIQVCKVCNPAPSHAVYIGTS